MRIRLNSIIVEDQEAALRFYTEVLGFVKKTDLPAGDYRWLTVVSPEEPDGTELVLEPNAHPAAAAYQKALFESVIPLTSFAVDDIEEEHRRLQELGVVFTQQVPFPVFQPPFEILEEREGQGRGEGEAVKENLVIRKVRLQAAFFAQSADPVAPAFPEADDGKDVHHRAVRRGKLQLQQMGRLPAEGGLIVPEQCLANRPPAHVLQGQIAELLRGNRPFPRGLDDEAGRVLDGYAKDS